MPTIPDNSMQSPEIPSGSGSTFARWMGRLGRLLLVFVILGVCTAVAVYWLNNRPKAQRRPPKPEATLVEAARVEPAAERVLVRAMGTVVPAVKIQLAARVSGQIVAISDAFTPGGRFADGEVILRIDRDDYELAVEQRAADLTKAESSLKLEMGQQSVAQREYELLGEPAGEEDEALLLRQPQLEATEASIAAAKALLDKAQLDLERTTITSPFRAIVQTRNVDVGSYVAPGTNLATLVGTDEYWIEVTVPVDELKWLGIPGTNDEPASTARIYHESAWGTDVFRHGEVARLLTEIEPNGKMARLLVSVKDPLDLDMEPGEAAPRPLILGLSVHVELEGRELTDVVRVPRTAFREGSRVWIMGSDGKLEIRDVRLIWGGAEYVYVANGFTTGELLVTSSLAAPMPGMLLRTAEEAGADRGAQENERAGEPQP